MMQRFGFVATREMQRDLEIFLSLTRERRLELLRNVTYLMRKDKIWCRWLGKYVIAGRNYAAPRELSWTKNSYFAFSRVMQDFLRSVGFSLKRTRARPRRLDNERHAFFPFFLSVPVSNGNCSFLLTRFILFFGAYCMYKKNESMKLGDWIFFKVKFRRRLNEIEGISTL